MSQIRFVQGDPEMIPYTHSAAVVGGDCLIVNDRTLIAHVDGAPDFLGSFGFQGGEYAATAATGDTFEIGDVIYWDDSGDEAAASATSNALLGVVTRAKISGQLEVYFEHLQNVPA